MKRCSRLLPTASERTLILLAGGMWLAVGTRLLALAGEWVAASTHSHRLLCLGVGLAMGLCAQRFGFSRLVAKNLARIRALNEPAPVTAFIPLKSLIIIAVMIGMGVALRHSPVPKLVLVPIYACMGSALMLASMGYAKAFATEPRP
jgi:hypothetical protein